MNKKAETTKQESNPKLFINFGSIRVLNSSNVLAFGYNIFTKVLRVQYSGGACGAYDYAEVPPYIAEELFACFKEPEGSVGRYIYKNIRPAFITEKVVFSD